MFYWMWVSNQIFFFGRLSSVLNDRREQSIHFRKLHMKSLKIIWLLPKNIYENYAQYHIGDNIATSIFICIKYWNSCKFYLLLHDSHTTIEQKLMKICCYKHCSILYSNATFSKNFQNSFHKTSNISTGTTCHLLPISVSCNNYRICLKD